VGTAPQGGRQGFLRPRIADEAGARHRQVMKPAAACYDQLMFRSFCVLAVIALHAAGCCSVTGGGGPLPPTCLPSCNPADCILINLAAPGLTAGTGEAVHAEIPLQAAVVDVR
jgi:hypothetical protein